MAIGPGRENPSKRKWQLAVFSMVLLCCLQVLSTGSREAVAGEESAPTEAEADLAYMMTDTLVVRASALADAVTPSAGGLVTRVDLDDEPGPRDISDELSQVAGIQVRRYGGVGFAAVPALRGASAAQIRIFLDGMPLNSAQTGTADLSKLPVERFSAAEIHRGAVPAGFGGMGGAGAINLITRDRAEGTDLRLFTGSFGDLGGRATWGVSGDQGRRSVLVLAHGRRVGNDYQYNDHNQTFNEPDDDTLRTRANAWFREWGMWGTARQETGSLEARLTAGYLRQDGGRPGPLNYPSPNSSVRFQRANGQARLSWKQALNLELSGAKEKQFLYDPANEIEDGFGGTIRSQGEDVTVRLSWTGNLLTSGGPLLPTVDVVAGVEERRQWYRQYYDTDSDPLRNRRTSSAFAATTVGFAANRLQVLPGWRWQRNEDNFPPVPVLPFLPEEAGVLHQRDDISPSLGAVWEICRERLFLQGHAARSIRVPTWIELFGHRGGIDGNRELIPEEITSADVAVTWRAAAGSGFGRLAFFRARTEQTIVFLQNSVSSSQAINLGQTRTRGLELEGSLTGLSGFSLTGNFTWQEAIDQGDRPEYNGNDLPYLSDRVLWLRLNRSVGRWQPWLEFSWASGKYRDRANTELNKASAREIVNLGLARDMDPGWLGSAGQLTVAVEVVNLFDNTVYDIEEFPLPGRSWQLSVRVRR